MNILIMGGGGGRHRRKSTSIRGRRFEEYLLFIIYLSRVLCLCVCVTICCGTICFSFSFSNQTDYRDETEGLEREGMGLEREEIKKERYGGRDCRGKWEATFHCLSLT